jgi:hypothetical protein
MSHTPGPWGIQPDEHGGPSDTVYAYEDQQQAVAEIVSGVIADRHLIAAAPDLLATCKALAHDIRAMQFTDGEYRLRLDVARQILALLDREITKATEGTNGKERSLD